jgi:hypothetical protein
MKPVREASGSLIVGGRTEGVARFNQAMGGATCVLRAHLAVSEVKGLSRCVEITRCWSERAFDQSNWPGRVDGKCHSGGRAYWGGCIPSLVLRLYTVRLVCVTELGCLLYNLARPWPCRLGDHTLQLTWYHLSCFKAVPCGYALRKCGWPGMPESCCNDRDELLAVTC